MIKLKELREKLSLSQLDCEKIFNIPVRTWQNWEEGKRKTPAYVYDTLINKMEEYLSILDIANDCEKILSIKCPKIKFIPKKEKSGVLAKVIVNNKIAKKINFALTPDFSFLGINLILLLMIVKKFCQSNALKLNLFLKKKNRVY